MRIKRAEQIVLAGAAEQMREGMALAADLAADSNEAWIYCGSCGSATKWIDVNGDLCIVCALSDWRSQGNLAFTGEMIADWISEIHGDVSTRRHRRLVARLVALYFAAVEESFPRQLCADCGAPAVDDPERGWHHIGERPASCWAPWMND